MPTSGTSPGHPESPLADAEFLTRAEHRIPLLAALSAEPRSRRELEDLASVSRTTVGRTLRAMERRRWVRRAGDRYEATPLGAFVSSSAETFVARLETGRELRDVWDLLPMEEAGFDLQAWADAEVTVAEANAPYAPVNRYVALLEESDRLRFVGFDIGLLEACMDDLRRLVLDGMRAEVVDPPGHAQYVLTAYPEFSEELLATGNVSVRVNDDVPPYGLGIVDDRVFVCGYHPDDGTARVLVDTESPSVREWAEEAFESYRRDARPLPDAPTS